ncbi:MAG: peptide chain release factor 1 [Acidimicrobiia bacterium]
MEDVLAARLYEVEAAFAEVEERLADPAVSSDPPTLAELGRRYAELREIVELLREWRRADDDARDAHALAGADPELADELERLAVERRAEADRLEEALRETLSPRDPDDARDAILEVRAAAGGDEAAIWAGDLLRMYRRFAERHGLRLEPMDTIPSDAGGFSRVTVGVRGRGAFGLLRHEAGVHRVQRVPRTESQGRIHTSTATVAVLPEAEGVEVVVDPAEVRVDVFRSSGPGGQSVNTTDSAVRLTHEPTGLVVTCQDEKSQLQNKEKAFRILRARLYQLERDRVSQERAGERRSQVGSGERSEKIRTYNFRDNRVTDHRIGLTIKRLDQVLDGDLDEIVEALTADERVRVLAGEP